MNIRDFHKHIGIRFEITRGCNMRCPYCYVINRQHQGEEITEEDWLALSRLLPKCLQGGKPCRRRLVPTLCVGMN